MHNITFVTTKNVFLIHLCMDGFCVIQRDEKCFVFAVRRGLEPICSNHFKETFGAASFCDMCAVCWKYEKSHDGLFLFRSPHNKLEKLFIFNLETSYPDKLASAFTLKRVVLSFLLCMIYFSKALTNI